MTSAARRSAWRRSVWWRKWQVQRRESQSGSGKTGASLDRKRAPMDFLAAAQARGPGTVDTACQVLVM